MKFWMFSWREWSNCRYLHDHFSRHAFKQSRVTDFKCLHAFFQILVCLGNLHFNDNQNDIAKDSLDKVRPVIDELKRKYSYCLKPYKNLCIDETLTL